MRRALLGGLLLLLVGCARLDIGAIGLHANVVKGGQAQIDAGYVVDYVALDGRVAGVLLAGHHTTHGAVFRNLDALRVGDEVDYAGRAYHVTRIIHWPSHALPGYLGPLVLQTSEPVGLLLVVAA